MNKFYQVYKYINKHVKLGVRTRHRRHFNLSQFFHPNLSPIQLSSLLLTSQLVSIHKKS